MQIRRDTEYAIRIIFCLAKDAEKRQMHVAEISSETEIARVIVLRLCRRLTETRIISCHGEVGMNSAFFLSEANYSKTLLDIIESIEMQKDVFAVFDKDSDFYQACGSCLYSVNNDVRAALNSVSVYRLVLCSQKPKVRQLRRNKMKSPLLLERVSMTDPDSVCCEQA